jgi:hypothetical protein
VRLLCKPFNLALPAGGSERRLVPHEHASLTPLFALIGTHVARAAISRQGDLDLAFDDGGHLHAAGLEVGWEYEPLPVRGSAEFQHAWAVMCRDTGWYEEDDVEKDVGDLIRVYRDHQDVHNEMFRLRATSTNDDLFYYCQETEIERPR